MRVLKTILIILLALVAIIAVLGFIGPDTYRYERSVTVNAPARLIYDNVRKFQKMNEWGPWKASDHDMVNTLTGVDGEIGSVWTWSGDTVGVGRQELVALVPDSSTRAKLTFTVPVIGDMESLSTFDLVPEGDGTKVTWGMEGETGFWGKVMGKFGDSDAEIGPMFEQGLAGLKAMSEAEAAAAKEAMTGGFVIETIERPETIYIGKRNKKVKWRDMGAFFASSFPAAGKAAGEARLEMVGAPSGVYFEWNEKDQTADLLAGMPVKAASDLKVPGMETVVVPASKVLHIPYYGAYEKVGAAHEAMDAYIKANNLTHYANVIEEYVTDPMTEKDTTKWLTNVYYLVK
ncbi:MAG TPA: SRPBCC family protein [Flavobacteriales bacterium]|nr:SRPBCC family protein [Flavobacteriales bacterium]